MKDGKKLIIFHQSFPKMLGHFSLLIILILFQGLHPITCNDEDYTVEEQSSSSESDERTSLNKFFLKNIKSNKRANLQDPSGYDEDYTYKSVCIVDGKPEILHGFDCRYQVAVGRFKNSINLTGWSYLEIETKNDYDPNLQAYAAGVLEGILTQPVVRYALSNSVDDYCLGYKAYCKRLLDFLNDNLQYVKMKVEKASPDDPYWQSVKRTYLQLTGLWHGYNGENFDPKISYEVHPIMMLNMFGDDIDLEQKLNKSKDPQLDDGIVNGKCSGLVKITPGNEDILISQVTMSGFQNLLRVMKLYKFGYDPELFPGHTSTFTGYPGVLYSSDDFTLMSSGLAGIETTVHVFNTTLYQMTSPQGQLLTWVRAIIANQLARTGREWCKIFAKHNSGTYNNQWIVLDYKRFVPKKELPDHSLLYVLEQLPGKIIYQDLTKYLKEKSYFPSYNIPFFKKIYEMSGSEAKAKELYWFSWSDCPRAKIFARDHSNVTDLDSLTKLMRYNDYTHEIFSRCNCTPPYTAEAAISARGDLNPANGTYQLPGMGHVNHGALDYKGTNFQLFKELRFRAISSPAYDNVPAFDWRKTDLAKTVKHNGHPNLWNFKPVEYKWETPI